MKKRFLMILVLILGFAMVSCDNTPKEEVDIAQIIFAGGTLDDGGFNQGSWEGIKDFADENGLNAKYYHAAENTVDSVLDSIALASKDGADVVVLPGFNFEVAVYKAQSMYPDIKFVLVDGAAHDGEYNYHTAENTVSIFYEEEEAGFLAGYALVKDGFTKLGFMGGMAFPAVVGFGYGFINGADVAAAELGLAKDEVEVKYTYVGNFEATPENQTLAGSWYTAGTEVIFACGGAVGDSVMQAAQANEGRFVVGVDIDQSGDSETVITSAVKNLSGSIYQVLTQWKDEEFPGGESLVLTVLDDGVGLPIETSRFRTFSKTDYETIYQNLVNDVDNVRTNIPKDDEYSNAGDVPTTLVKVVDLG